MNPKFQTFLGIGGASPTRRPMFSQMSTANQEALLEAYFGEDGIGYTIIRTSIHSCDFGLEAHTSRRGCGAGDILHRGGHGGRSMISEPPSQNRIRLLCQPVEPAGVHEDQREHALWRSLLPEYRDAWAQYFVKFIEALRQRACPFGGDHPE